MTYVIPVAGETHFTAQCEDLLLEPILERREVKVQQPVMRNLRVIRRRYSDSELSSAAVMLDKLRRGMDRVSPRGVDQDVILDTLVEKIIDTLG
jgi:hypothetical protein